MDLSKVDWIALPLMPLKPLFDGINHGGVRHFWIYILTGLVIAMVAHRLSGNRQSFAETFFARDIWLSRSALNDYGILMLNPVIQFVWMAWLIANFDIIAHGTASLLVWAGVGQAPATTATWVIISALTVCLFVVDDFFRWFIHYLQHRIPVLWEFHKVHHSAETLNFATAERFHPIDILLSSAGAALGAALVNGLFIANFGDDLTVATVAGANIFWVGFNIAGGVLRHSPAWVRFGPSLERWFISPAMHQIHHSDNPRHFDSNFGGSLAVWDRWFGTIYIPAGREITGYGIGPETAEYRTLGALYGLPFVKAARLIAAWLRPAVDQSDADRAAPSPPSAASAASAASAPSAPSIDPAEQQH